MAKLTCYGGAGSTTGANFMLEIGEKKVLIDCGMEQGGRGAFERNKQPFVYDPKSAGMLFVTHSHIDHIGLIPKLCREGFEGEIYSTPETREVAELLLMDAVKIGRQEKESLYGPDDVAKAFSLWKTMPYHEVRDFGDFTIELLDAGHVLGSSMVRLVSRNGKTMLFTGDIGNSPSPLLKDAEKVSGLDYLLMESVYGDRTHEHKELREEKFKEVVLSSIKRGGALLIPAFSLERTQMILAMLDNLFESQQVPRVPVFLDSPLAIRITSVYERVSSLFNDKAQAELKAGDHLFRFDELKSTAHVQDSQQIKTVSGPKIIIAGSGMSTAGRILAHEEHYLPDPNSTILFTGYQAAGTLGRQIAEGMKKIVIDGGEVAVRARVEQIGGFSGHADSDALVEFVSQSAKTLKMVFVAMGELRAEIFLAQRLRDELGVRAVATEEGKSYEVEL
jgi:metallo-beta-lactamase family protein